MAAGENTSAVIGKSVEIRGEVKGSEDLLVDGHVEGTITLTGNRLTIGSHANVTANIAAGDVILLGRLHGNIRATGRVDLRKGSELVGDIVSSRLSIEENASFKGKVDLVESSTSTPSPGSAASARTPGQESSPAKTPAQK